MSQSNLYGMWSLYIKEVRRFLKVYNQTLFAPMVNALLFLAVFSLALGNRVSEIGGVPFQQFMIPGLIMMTMVQNAFANTSSSLTMGKVLGSIIDYLMPPLSAGEITFAMALAGITRGITTGIAVACAAYFFVPFGVEHVGWLIFYAVFACLMLSLLGLVAGVLSDSFDKMSAITSYVITPLSFLSGTFYSVKALPEVWQTINHANPFFYMVDGFRYSMTGYSDVVAQGGSMLHGAAILLSTNVVLYIVCYTMFKKGYKIKS